MKLQELVYITNFNKISFFHLLVGVFGLIQYFWRYVYTCALHLFSQFKFLRDLPKILKYELTITIWSFEIVFFYFLQKWVVFGWPPPSCWSSCSAAVAPSSSWRSWSSECPLKTNFKTIVCHSKYIYFVEDVIIFYSEIKWHWWIVMRND